MLIPDQRAPLAVNNAAGFGQALGHIGFFHAVSLNFKQAGEHQSCAGLAGPHNALGKIYQRAGQNICQHQIIGAAFKRVYAAKAHFKAIDSVDLPVFNGIFHGQHVDVVTFTVRPLLQQARAKHARASAEIQKMLARLDAPGFHKLAQHGEATGPWWHDGPCQTRSWAR